MKRILVIAAALLFGASAFAQQKGDFFVGGNLGFGTGAYTYSDKTINLDDNTSTERKSNHANGISFYVTPEVGYFIMDNLKIGASVSADINTYPTEVEVYEHDGEGNIKLDKDGFEIYNIAKKTGHTERFFLNLSANYYLKLLPSVYYTPGIKLYGYLGGDTDYQSDFDGVRTVKRSFSGFGATLQLLALEIRPTEHIALCADFGGLNFYHDLSSQAVEKIRWEDRYDGISFDIFNGASIGVRYYF